MANTLVFYADYTASGVGVAPSPAPTIAVYRVNRSTGAESVEVAAGAAMTASSLTGRYFYRLTGADLQTYDYHARATTSDATVDQRDQPALWVRWSEAVTTAADGSVTAGAVADKSGYGLTVDYDAAKTALPAASYTAPDNAGIAAIRAKTDNLPADPASNTQVNTRLAATDYTAPPTAAAIAAQVDTTLSTSHGDGQWDAVGSGGSGGMTLADLQGELDARHVDLTHLDRLDDAITSRLAAADYAAAPTAAAISAQVAGDLATAHGAGPWGTADVSALATTAALSAVAADVTTLGTRLTASRATLLDNLDGLVSLSGGTISGVTSATQFSAPVSADLGAGSGDYEGKQVFFTSGVLAGTRWLVAAHAQSAGRHDFTLDDTPSQAPAVGDTFEVI